jgi:hypothetical protein
MEDQQQNDLLRIKMQEYTEYIQQMIKEVNIIKKSFYIIVGYNPVALQEGVFGHFIRAINPTRAIKQKQEDFLRNRKTLMSRLDQVASRMSGLDLKVELLNTQQLIALLYNSYNPDILESIQLKDVSSLDITL